MDFARRHARYAIDAHDTRLVVLRDLGPWDQHPTVTNDAAWVIAQVAPQLDGRRLFYFDSSGTLDELLVVDGAFAGFRTGRGRILKTPHGFSLGTVEPMPASVSRVIDSVRSDLERDPEPSELDRPW